MRRAVHGATVPGGPTVAVGGVVGADADTLPPVGTMDRFALLMSSKEEDIAVEEAALVLASVFRPGVVIGDGLARLDDVADGCAPRIEAIVERLFGELGFVGNRSDYHDPANSWLDQVLERRLGIPITLSIVVMAVGRRAGVEIEGIGMPAHFLCRDRATGLYIDPFGGGTLLDRDGVGALFRSLNGDHLRLTDQMLAPVGSRLIIRRMLNNLAQIATHRCDRDMQITATKLRALLPDASTRDRLELAGAYMAGGDLVRAANVLEAACAEAPDEERATIARFAAEVRGRLN